MFHELSAEQRRQTLDTLQVYDAWRTRTAVLKHRYAGSMRWLHRSNQDYLHRKIGQRERSLGPRSSATEATYDAFLGGRSMLREEVKALTAALDRRAPVLKAFGLGRVPRITARILRKLDEHALLGQHLVVVGTHALFAYEAAAGVQIDASLLATGDIDLLWDARKGLRLVAPDVRAQGVLKLLQQVDRSFRQRGTGDYRASNQDGFWVELLRADDRTFRRSTTRPSIGEATADLEGVPVDGRQWLISSPAFDAIGIAEDGYPVRIATIDPRTFALRKTWLAEQESRDPLKRPRDRGQAVAAASIATTWLDRRFDEPFLAGLPLALSRQLPKLQQEVVGSMEALVATADDDDSALTPRW